jgi:geranylgeranyl diphosphate synthase type I
METNTGPGLLSSLSSRLDLVNHCLDSHILSIEPENLSKAAHHLCSAGGKRLRPLACILSAESILDKDVSSISYEEFPCPDGSIINIIDAAASVELIHIFTLIHDDIMDDDDLRRGVPSVHTKFNTELAILAGDVLYSKAFEVLGGASKHNANSSRALSGLAAVCSDICSGQALDIQFSESDSISTDDYLKMIELKTGVLFGESAALPAQLMGQDQNIVDALYNYGTFAGIAFQIQDDLLDLTTPSSVLGKQRGSDLLEQKQTLLTIHARESGFELDSFFEDSNSVSEAIMDDIVSELEDIGTISYARELSESYITQSKKQLNILPPNDSRSILLDIVDFFNQRKY